MSESRKQRSNLILWDVFNFFFTNGEIKFCRSQENKRGLEVDKYPLIKNPIRIGVGSKLWILFVEGKRALQTVA